MTGNQGGLYPAVESIECGVPGSIIESMRCPFDHAHSMLICQAADSLISLRSIWSRVLLHG